MIVRTLLLSTIVLLGYSKLNAQEQDQAVWLLYAEEGVRYFDHEQKAMPLAPGLQLSPKGFLDFYRGCVLLGRDDASLLHLCTADSLVSMATINAAEWTQAAGYVLPFPIGLMAGDQPLARKEAPVHIAHPADLIWEYPPANFMKLQTGDSLYLSWRIDYMDAETDTFCIIVQDAFDTYQDTIAVKGYAYLLPTADYEGWEHEFAVLGVYTAGGEKLLTLRVAFETKPGNSSPMQPQRVHTALQALQMAWVMECIGEPLLAREWYQKAMTLSPHRKEALLFLYRQYEQRVGARAGR